MTAETARASDREAAASILYADHIASTLGNPAWVARVNRENPGIAPMDVLTTGGVSAVVEAMWPLVRETWIAKVRT